jgi:ribosome biogenesis GTPase
VAGNRKRKVRVAFRKNRRKRARAQELTREARRDLEAVEDLQTSERLSGKGELTRRRTVISAAETDAGGRPLIDLDGTACVSGRVLYAIGANQCRVESDDGEPFDCVVRRVVRTLARDARNAVVPGDRVLFQTTGSGTGVIERVEPRTTSLSRVSGHAAHVIAANVEQAVIIASAAQPQLKPGLIDRFIVTAEQGGLRPIVCINKIDLVDPLDLQPIAGVYARIGYDVVLSSAEHDLGIARLRRLLAGKQSVFSGQSGVGKSSLLNAIAPALRLRTCEVSGDTGKGRHTTRVGEMFRLPSGGWVIDTPGIRQLALWDVPPAEVEAYFREFRPFVPHCRFPDCTHVHEVDCAVVSALNAGDIAPSRYLNYVRIVTGDD